MDPDLTRAFVGDVERDLAAPSLAPDEASPAAKERA